jgi:hypothetical protein
MARMSFGGDHASGYRLNVELDSRRASDADVRHNLSHEMREGADLVRRLQADPKTDVAAQQRAGVFAPGTATDVTSHAKAAAFELGDVFAEMRPTLTAYDRALTAATGSRGVAVPDPVRRGGEAAYRRLDAMLDSLGFADPATRATKRGPLLAELGVGEGSPLATFVDGYGQRAEARVRRQQALNALDPAARTGLGTGLGPDLDSHLAQRMPAEAVAPLAELMGRNDPGNLVRGFLREVVRQHRAGRLSDAALVETVGRLNGMLQAYGDRLLDPDTARRITSVLQSERGPAATRSLERISADVVQRGLPGAGEVLRPEAGYLADGEHGVRATEAQSRARAASHAGATRAGPGPFDEGKFGSPADVDYAVRCAARDLGSAGNAAGRPDTGIFLLPPGHGNVVYRHGQTATVVPDVVFVQVDRGMVHAYPAVSTVVSINAVTGPIRPVVVW